VIEYPLTFPSVVEEARKPWHSVQQQDTISSWHWQVVLTTQTHQQPQRNLTTTTTSTLNDYISRTFGSLFICQDCPAGGGSCTLATQSDRRHNWQFRKDCFGFLLSSRSRLSPSAVPSCNHIAVKLRSSNCFFKENKIAQSNSGTGRIAWWQTHSSNRRPILYHLIVPTCCTTPTHSTTDEMLQQQRS